jgi:glycyl-tRNA synthetase beta chain
MNQSRADFLIEIGTEELPPKSLYHFATSFAKNIVTEIQKANLPHGECQYFTTPRRLAVLVSDVASHQADQIQERWGPIESLAFDELGKPTQAALGFAKSCHIAVSDLTLKMSQKGNCLYFGKKIPGESFVNLAPSLVKNALNQLPIPKPMIWGNHSMPFIRPVHWLLVLYGKNVVPCQLFDLKADNKTYGHRFHHPSAITIAYPKQFSTALVTKGFVIADYQERKESINQQILSLAKSKGQAILDQALLDEVTGLVEWPVALLGSFDKRFLQVPQEALISAMTIHQKSFPLVNNQGNLLPFFIFVANIEAKDPNEIIIGNERVMCARLSDAEFFYHSDLKIGLDEYLGQLKNIIFQNKLGTLYEKTLRISKLAEYIALEIQSNPDNAGRAGLLCKADLTTEMVVEFPELQGIMGYYYAIQNGESQDVATAIKEHYQPKYAGDEVPKTPLGIAVALADKLDTLVGIFGINQAPSGEKDPYALRRTALGILRILIENSLTLDLKNLLEEAAKGYPSFEKDNLIEETLSFIMERLRAWYLEQGMQPDVYMAVYARYPTKPFDFDQRIKAVHYFQQLPEAKVLSAANKRVSNILKQTNLPPHTNYNYALFELEPEKNLANIIEQQSRKILFHCNQYQYKEALTLLASMRDPIDHFFDEVMVMVEDERLRNNRLILLNNLRQLFLQIADISLLQT